MGFIFSIWLIFGPLFLYTWGSRVKSQNISIEYRGLKGPMYTQLYKVGLRRILLQMLPIFSRLTCFLLRPFPDRPFRSCLKMQSGRRTSLFVFPSIYAKKSLGNRKEKEKCRWTERQRVLKQKSNFTTIGKNFVKFFGRAERS